MAGAAGGQSREQGRESLRHLLGKWIPSANRSFLIFIFFFQEISSKCELRVETPVLSTGLGPEAAARGTCFLLIWDVMQDLVFLI